MPSPGNQSNQQHELDCKFQVACVGVDPGDVESMLAENHVKVKYFSFQAEALEHDSPAIEIRGVPEKSAGGLIDILQREGSDELSIYLSS